jgi:hypothetical protein
MAGEPAEDAMAEKKQMVVYAAAYGSVDATTRWSAPR